MARNVAIVPRQLFVNFRAPSHRSAQIRSREKALLDRHDRAAREEVKRFRGRLIRPPATASWQPSTRAHARTSVCVWLIEKLADSGLGIRAAIHMGEIELLDEDIGGIGVHIAARALGKAGERQVVVTSTVRDLATGADLVFTPLGLVGLRGVPGEWELFEASIN